MLDILLTRIRFEYTVYLYKRIYGIFIYIRYILYTSSITTIWYGPYHCYQHYGYTITIFIEYVAHLCENSFDSWTPSGVLYFKRPNLPDLNSELVPSWIQDGSSFTQKAYVIWRKNMPFVLNPTWNFSKYRSGPTCIE